MLNNKKIISGFSFLIIFTLIFSFTTEKLRAESISPEKAIEIGLKNSAEIEDLKNNIDQIKRNIESVKAQKDWKIDFACPFFSLQKTLSNKIYECKQHSK